ncbi:UNVERIFIED_CONTAM: hypothetical protein K2H54_069357 [Gekko kuhli]
MPVPERRPVKKQQEKIWGREKEKRNRLYQGTGIAGRVGWREGEETTTGSTSAFVVPATTKADESDRQANCGAVAISWVVGLALVAFGIHFI